MIAVLKILDDPNAWRGWGMLFGMVFVVWPLIIFWCAPAPAPAACRLLLTYHPRHQGA